MLLIMVGLILAGAIRSAIATHLDSFDIDEAYHIAAGVSYLRLGDFRLNPEHPPLVKLWVAAFLPPGSFHLPPLRPLADKVEERHFTAETVYLNNDPDRVQERARIAMFTLTALLLLGFGLAVWRMFHPLVALGSIAFLVIDPTVAAHLPLVLTDLPLSLLASTGLLLSFIAFRTWRVRELTLAGLVLGLTLGVKHTALVIVTAIILLGIAMALKAKSPWRTRLVRICLALAVAGVAWMVLWALYGFHYQESPGGHETFNRPLAAKIADINSPAMRTTVSTLEELHVLPRPYLWGLADIIRAGVEGRIIPVYLWNRSYIRKPPFYFFPAIVFFKLPVGLVVLCLLGFLLLCSKVPSEWRPGLWLVIGFAAFILAMLATGSSSYAGVRHALPVFPVLAVLAGVVCAQAVLTRSKTLRIVGVLSLGAALISAIPVIRPWEYYNELAGGPDFAYKHFDDEGLESGQRIKELAAYYHQTLQPKGIVPYLDYWFFFNDEELKERGVRTMQSQWAEDGANDNSDVVTGTAIINAKWIAPKPWLDYAAFRAIQPAERFGNLLIYRGTFHLQEARAGRMFMRAIDAIYSRKPDLVKGERFLRESVASAPNLYFANLELGNLLAHRGARAEALQAYRAARTSAPAGEDIVNLLSLQIERVSREDPASVPAVRDPFLE